MGVVTLLSLDNTTEDQLIQNFVTKCQTVQNSIFENSDRIMI